MDIAHDIFAVSLEAAHNHKHVQYHIQNYILKVHKNHKQAVFVISPSILPPF